MALSQTEFRVPVARGQNSAGSYVVPNTRRIKLGAGSRRTNAVGLVVQSQAIPAAGLDGTLRPGRVRTV